MPQQHLQLPNLGMLHFILFIAIIVVAENDQVVFVFVFVFVLQMSILA